MKRTAENTNTESLRKQGTNVELDSLRSVLSHDLAIQKIKEHMLPHLGRAIPYVAGGYPLSYLYGFEPDDIDVFIQLPEPSSAGRLLAQTRNASVYSHRMADEIAEKCLVDGKKISSQDHLQYPDSFLVYEGRVPNVDRKVQMIFFQNKQPIHFDVVPCEIFFNLKTDELDGRGLLQQTMTHDTFTATHDDGYMHWVRTCRSLGRMMKYILRGVPANDYYLTSQGMADILHRVIEQKRILKNEGFPAKFAVPSAIVDVPGMPEFIGFYLEKRREANNTRLVRLTPTEISKAKTAWEQADKSKIVTFRDAPF